jgi:hypothetical protein
VLLLASGAFAVDVDDPEWFVMYQTAAPAAAIATRKLVKIGMSLLLGAGCETEKPGAAMSGTGGITGAAARDGAGVG